jgi:homoserine O-succinyltransferase
MLPDGKNEPVFEGLRDPFYSVDSRDYQVIEPDHTRSGNGWKITGH